MVPEYKFYLIRNHALLPLTLKTGYLKNDGTVNTNATDYMYTLLKYPSGTYTVSNSKTSVSSENGVRFNRINILGEEGEAVIYGNSITIEDDIEYLGICIYFGTATTVPSQLFDKSVVNAFMISGFISHEVLKNWSADLAIEYKIESEEKFYRKSLDGDLLFLGDDYKLIHDADFESIFYFKIEYNNDGTYQEIFSGTFLKADCEIDEDRKTVKVSPETTDEYNDVLNGMDKEYDLMKLPIAVESLAYVKRPAIQIYRLGSNKVGYYLGGSYWEADAQNIISDNAQLQNTYHFAYVSVWVEIKLTAENHASTSFNGIYAGEYDGTSSQSAYFKFNKTDGSAYIEFRRDAQGYHEWKLYMKGGSSGDIEAGYTMSGQLPATGTFYLTAYSSDARMRMEMVRNDYYVRYLCDVDSISDVSTYDIPENDVCADNKNYHKCIDYSFDDIIVGSSELSDEPTEWGRNEDGQYYVKPKLPSMIGGGALYPVVRSEWAYTSVWFMPYIFDTTLETFARKEYTLRDAYEFSSCVKALLSQIAPGISHEATSEYSQFLYGSTNPIGPTFRLFISQKTNILNGYYTQPAQKAPCTLRQLTDMLKNCFKCYWYIEDSKFKIEHIEFFRGGGSYYSTQQVGLDLTAIYDKFINKPLAFVTSVYKYDKADLPERYQYGWMDNVQDIFEGFPVDILSNYVEKGNIEEVTVENFNSDIDMMLLNPAAMSEDGFAIFAATGSDGNYKLPIVSMTIGDVEYTMQNGYMAFCYLQQYFLNYDMPGIKVRINNVETTAINVRRSKTQDINFIFLNAFKNFDVNKFIKTYLGNGRIESISIKLSTLLAKATLKYDV